MDSNGWKSVRAKKWGMVFRCGITQYAVNGVSYMMKNARAGFIKYDTSHFSCSKYSFLFPPAGGLRSGRAYSFVIRIQYSTTMHYKYCRP